MWKRRVHGIKLLKLIVCASEKVDKKPSSQLITLKGGKASCSLHLMTDGGWSAWPRKPFVCWTASLPFADLMTIDNQNFPAQPSPTQTHFWVPLGWATFSSSWRITAANLYEPDQHQGHAAKRLLFGIVDRDWCQISCIEYRSRGTGYSSKDILRSMLVPLPCAFHYNNGIKRAIYLSLPKYIKHQGCTEPLSLCEGHHVGLRLCAVLLHDEVHRPMSRSVCKLLEKLCSWYPASVLERNRSSSVRIWAISNLQRISSCTATQCAIHPCHFSS